MNEPRKTLVAPSPDGAVLLSTNRPDVWVKVDVEDAVFLADYTWQATEPGYAFNCKLGLMHRWLVKATDPVYSVHHINGDGFDNRRVNLEPMHCSDHAAMHRAMRRAA